MSRIEDKLAELGLELPEHVAPAGSYLVAYRAGDLVFTSAVGPRTNESNITGVMGKDCTVEDGYEAARRTCLRMLTNVKSVVGDLDKVKHVVKVFGMVNCAPGFNNTPAVIDGCSQLFLDVFGDDGVHTRAAVGMAELQFDICVEVEALFLLRD